MNGAWRDNNSADGSDNNDTSVPASQRLAALNGCYRKVRVIATTGAPEYGRNGKWRNHRCGNQKRNE